MFPNGNGSAGGAGWIILDIDAVAGGIISARGRFDGPAAVVVVFVVVVRVAVVVLAISERGVERLRVCIQQKNQQKCGIDAWIGERCTFRSIFWIDFYAS